MSPLPAARALLAVAVAIASAVAVVVAVVPSAQAAEAWTTLPALLARPHISASRAMGKVKIDGRLDDAAWVTATPSDTFTQHFPDEGAPPSERTVVLVLYDDRNLYVGIDCEQLHSPIVRRLQRRDGPLPSDGVWIDIDSRRSGVGAFHFSINAAGALSDGIHYDDTNFTSDFDAVWEAKVADTPRGYSVEFRIPLSVLRFSAAPVQDWGFQVRRFIDARQEYDDWAFYPRSASTYVPLFGRIDDLVGLKPKHALELRPFVLGRAGHRAAGADATLAQGWEATGSVGLDAKAHVTNELALDLTVNPDFGQVEADTVILNLTTFETFFPEKRPFFLEGIDVFSSIRPLVYTRRIGHVPAIALAPGEVLVAPADPSRIWGAAKLVGSLGGRTSVGLLSAVTGENEIEIQAATGVRRRAIAEPWTTYNAFRLKHLWGDNADVGVLATAVTRLESPAAGVPRATNDAYVASTDGRWRSGAGNYSVAWQALATTLRGGSPRAQRDGLAINPGTVSGGGSLYVGKDGGTHWLANAWQHVASRELEINDMGYLDRKNDYNAQFTATYRTLDPWWRTLQTNTWLAFKVRKRLEDGMALGNELKLASSWDLRGFWNVLVDVHLRPAYFDDREMGDGSALERAGAAGVNVDTSSDPRRRVTGGLNVAFDRRRGGGAKLDASGRVTFRALPQLELDLLPTASYERGAVRYISTGAPMVDPTTNLVTATYTFGDQTAATVGVTLRAAYTFTPELSLQLYTQAFLARVRYGTRFTFENVQGVRTQLALSALVPAPPPAMRDTSADTDDATLNVNLVLRWEYRLGSTLFLVYTRAQNPSLVPASDGSGFQLRPLWQGRASADFLMLKLAYWWG